MTEPRKGQAPEWPMPREEFTRRFRMNFYDPAFDQAKDAIDRLEAIAWESYKEDRKAPRTAKAGPEFHDPDYDLSVEWRAARDKLIAAEKQQKDPATPSRVLVICGSSRNDGSCPGEISKTRRLVQAAREVVGQTPGFETDFLDLSTLADEPWKVIHPCKACVSTSMAAPGKAARMVAWAPHCLSTSGTDSAR